MHEVIIVKEGIESNKFLIFLRTNYISSLILINFVRYLKLLYSEAKIIVNGNHEMKR